MTDKDRFYECPQGHKIREFHENYARDFSEDLTDADGIPMFENGLYCFGCKTSYGLSKLSLVED